MPSRLRVLVSYVAPWLILLGLAAAPPVSAATSLTATSETTTAAGDPETIDLSDEDGDGTWSATTSIVGGVNIIGVTWSVDGGSQGVEDAATTEDAEHTEDADHAEDASSPGTARFRVGTSGSWEAWHDMEVSTTDESTGTEGNLALGPADLEVSVTPNPTANAKIAAPVLTIWHEGQESADTAASLDVRTDGSKLQGADESEQLQHSMSATRASGPVIATRSQWGADESLRKWSPNYIDETRGVTIHHTAGTNNYTAAQVPAILRGIYRYHAVTRDWGDVGYNLFVDKFGRAWEGRRGGPERSLRTAHALGMNYATAGISMLGDYNRTSVPRAAFDGMAQVTSWKLLTHGIPRNGRLTHTNKYEDWTRTLNVVHGHRDVNQTSCPGAKFYARMGEFRSRVTSFSRGVTAQQRVSGSDRYETAAKVASAAHPFGVDTVYITRGDALTRALTVGAAAAHNDDALLLTRSDSLPAATAKQIRALKPKRIVVVGDPTAIKTTVLRQIRSISSTGETPVPLTRNALSGYAVAADLAQSWSTSDVVYVASGKQSVDALSGGAAAAHDDAPLLLTNESSLTSSTAQELKRLRPREVVMLGGPGRLSTEVANQIRAAVPDAELNRIGGTDRYQTSAMVSSQRFSSSSRALMAEGVASIDALAGTQFAASTDSPVLLSRKGCRPKSVASAMNGLGTDLHVLLGGPTRLSDRSATTVCR